MDAPKTTEPSGMGADTITSLPSTADAELIAIRRDQTPIPDKLDNPFLVAFSGPNDASNPKNWSVRRKWAVTNVLSATGFNRIMVSTIMAPALPHIAQEFSMNSTETILSFLVVFLRPHLGHLSSNCCLKCMDVRQSYM